MACLCPHGVHGMHTLCQHTQFTEPLGALPDKGRISGLKLTHR